MKKKLSVEDIENAALNGEDVTVHMKNMKMGHNSARIQKIHRTSLDLGVELMNEINEISKELNVSRQSLIKIVMKNYIMRYKFSKSA